MQLETYKIQITGRVQGVGFRPFIYNLAIQHQLAGSVSNNANGVIIFINTSKEKAVLFVEEIKVKKPEVSIIISATLEEIENRNFTDFSIVFSETKSQINIPLTPDFAVCESCKDEISNPKNKRFNYAFTTCVHCGPRYAITTKFPFERKNTSISNFEMCPDCNQEYADPKDKRFHSQTNSCTTCGIKLQLKNNQGELVEDNQEKVILRIANELKSGNAIAIKNTNGYLLCCDATNTNAIQKLRLQKKRPNKPFAVLYPNIETVKDDFNLSPTQEKTITSNIAPIVILQNTKNTSIATETIAPNLSQTGVMLPSSSLLELIMQTVKSPIIATSGNIHGSSIISDEEEAQRELKSVADYFVHHNLDIQFPQDDSVINVVDNHSIILRRSRGLAPNYIEVNTESSVPILAMGAHLKSTFTFVPNSQTYVSQYFGNLDSYSVLERYQKTINEYTGLFNSTPKTILVDAHSQYQSSILGKELALKWDTELIEVQHHKAHFASVLGEHDLFNSEEKILGVVWDGTGLGDDTNIWGGEFFTYQNKNIKRVTHFEYFDWIANDKMAKEPRLSLFSLLDIDDKHLIKNKFSDVEWKIYSKMLASNTLKTSSVGRLFDAVASLLNIVDINSYEAEGAMLLENCAMTYSKSYYLDFLHNVNYETIPTKLILKSIIKAYNSGICKERIAYGFIYTLAKSIVTLSKKYNTSTVACSGGVFQNSSLIKILSHLCRSSKINLKLNCKLSANDENISFGQLMYYQHCKK